MKMMVVIMTTMSMMLLTVVFQRFAFCSHIVMLKKSKLTPTSYGRVHGH